MNELLEKILSSDILNEETKAELSASFTALIESETAAARAEAEVAVRAQLTEQWIEERDALVEAMDANISEIVAAEFAELKEDIASFRDLEVEYASKLVEAKADLATQLDADLDELVESMDQFIELKLRAEMDELKESIDEVRKNELGRRAFDLFAREYRTSFVNKSEIEQKLSEAEVKLAELSTKLDESAQVIAQKDRAEKMSSLLSALSGKQRDIMESILKSTPTNKLEESYNMFLGRVLKESAKPAKEKQKKVLAESVATDDVAIVTGDQPKRIIEESVIEVKKPNAELEKLRVLAGIASK